MQMQQYFSNVEYYETDRHAEREREREAGTLDIVSMIRKYHNYKMQTNPWHREEEPNNNHETPGRQIKQSNQLSLPRQNDCKTRMETK